MNNKSKWLIVLTIIASILLNLLVALLLNSFRISLAAELEEKGSLVPLIESNLLAPSEAKKTSIAEIYTSYDDYKKAEKYLKQLKSEEGKEKYLECALENGDFDAAEKLLEQINSEKREEYSTVRDFLKGDYESIKQIPLNPQTNLGKLILSINRSDYKSNLESFLGKKLNEVSSKSNGTEATALEYARYLSENNQEKLAIYMLGELKKDSPELIDLWKLEAKINAKKGDYKKALELQEKAINLNVAAKELYAIALEYAIRAQDKVKIESLMDKFNYLEIIQK